MIAILKQIQNMEKVIGIDLGTNSIGWALRDPRAKGNQIVDKGVLIFDKGVGEVKGIETPLVKPRTEARGKRRNYQAEKYRKWELLQFLIQEKMCPLTIKELDEWRKYKKGLRRKYPQSEKFIQWLRFDFNGDGKPDFEQFGFDKHESYYVFRMLIVNEDEGAKKIFQNNPHILGRVFYQLVQRRGYRGRDDEDEEAKTILRGSEKNGTVGAKAIMPYLQKHRTLGAALYHLHKEKKERIRKRYNLRSDYERELKEICRVQCLDEQFYKPLWKAIIWQRPLRSQKGLVGACTFEKNKARCPVSHPLYEEYRTWVFINNLKIELPKTINKKEYLKENIYPLFFKASDDFKLSSIAKVLDKVGGKITARFPHGTKDEKGKYKKGTPDTKVVSAKLLNSFLEIFGENWRDVTIETNDTKRIRKKDGTFKEHTINYTFEDIWHVLFSFDSKDKLNEFASGKLKLEADKAEKICKIRLQQGYATLSLSAIKKLLPYLTQGFIYSEAVYLANLHKVLGAKELTSGIIEEFSIQVRSIIDQQKTEKLLISTVNNLISDQLNSDSRFGMHSNYQLDDNDSLAIENKLNEQFGSSTWAEIGETQKRLYFDFTARNYKAFLQKPINHKKEDIFLKTPRLHDKIFTYLKDVYSLPDKNIKYLWHPSEQETYLPAKVKNGIKQLGDPQPISRGFKNPMALKTLHKLKQLVNHLLETAKIDEDTRVVVEIARELNDANRRRAIEKWQRDRENKNDEYKKKIKEVAIECNLDLDTTNKKIIDKYRLWVEQNHTCLYTGQVINICDLFNGLRFDFEHTIPASLSFDNELKNLSISESKYNREVKGDSIPYQCPNYHSDATVEGILYTAIKPRLKFIEEKAEHLENLLDEWRAKSKFASTKEIKDACIQRRHYISFDLEYWHKKLDTFTCKEYKAGWRNSQLRDTQIVTKYALPYLKTAFNKVEVQKGTVTAAFREIYRIQPRLEPKDRSKHSHHAIDAAVLTLIPPAAIRDKILLRYNEEKDKNANNTYHEKPTQWNSFESHQIRSIEEEVLINHLAQNRTLTQTFKNVRKRGKQQFVKEKIEQGKWQYKLGEDGKKIPLVAKGSTIRGQLHKESFFGAVKFGEQLWLVERYPISTFTSITDCKNIIDKAVREIVQTTIEKRMADGQTFDQAKMLPIPFPSGKEVIKKVRCKVAAGRGYLTPGKALEIHKHTYKSKHEHKQYTYAQNEENTLCLYYEDANKIKRAFRIVGLHELAQLKLGKIDDIRSEAFYKTIELGKGESKFEISISQIITVGMRALFFKESIEELKDLSTEELIKRLYAVYKFNEVGSPYIYLHFHLEARPNDSLGDGDTIFDPAKYQPRLKLKADKFKCALENKDFEVTLDGQIKILFP